MRRLKLSAILATLLLTSCGATLRLSGTAPLEDNDGSCGARVLVPNASSSVWIHAVWTGPEAGGDSTFVAKGSQFSFTRQVPSGTYTIRLWASDAGGVGCDTLVTRTYESAPDRPQVAP